MTVTAETSSITYTGNGTTVAFSFPYRFLENAHLRVIRTVISTGVETELALDSGGANGFTVTGAGDPDGGTITVVTAPTALQRLTIDLGNVPATQTQAYIPNTTLPAQTVERGLDKLTMLVQNVMSGIGISRVLKLIVGDTDGSGRYNANGNRIVSLGDGVAATDAATVGQVSEATGLFVAAGTGAVSRTLQSKNRDVVSVFDFGVPADGVTDIAESLALAINNRSAGAALHFPAGDYYLVGNIDVTLTSPLALVLDPDARIVGDADDVPMLTIRGGAGRYGLTVLGGHFDNGDRTYNAAVQSGTALSLVSLDDFYIAGATFGRSTRDWADNKGDSGITTDKCQRGMIVGCVFYGQPDLGIYVTGGADAAETDDNGEIVVQGCHFYRCNAGASAKRGLGRMIVQGNTFYECRVGVSMFEAGGLPPGRSPSIIGNTFKYTEAHPIRIHGEGGGTIVGNVIEDIGFNRALASVAARGIWLNGASRCVVANNVIRFRDWVSDANHYGIDVRSATIDAVVYPGEENHISDNLIEAVNTGILETSAGVNHYAANDIIGAATAMSGINTGARGSYWDGTTFRSLIAGTAYVEEGTYTPTLTNTTNITSSTAFACQYQRVGKTVTVSGKAEITATANSAITELRVSLPIPAVFTAEEQAVGTANPAEVTGAGTSGAFKALASGAADVARLRFMSGTGAAATVRTWYFHFTYRIP